MGISTKFVHESGRSAKLLRRSREEEEEEGREVGGVVAESYLLGIETWQNWSFCVCLCVAVSSTLTSWRNDSIIQSHSSHSKSALHTH